MPRISFDELPDHGRLWVFPATRPLGADERVRLLTEVDGFLQSWAAHGAALSSARELRDDAFLLIGVDEDAEAPSGCSIDALVNRLDALGQDLGVRLIDHAPVWFRDGEAVRSVSRTEFRAMARDSQVDPSTTVFDTSLTRVSALREGGLERQARETWHGKAFFKESLAG